MDRIWILLIVLLLVACTDDVDKPADKASPTTISGIAALGMVDAGTVSAYDFNGCTLGNKLAEVKLSDSNNFEFTIQPTTNDQAILLTLTNLSYLEESSGEKILDIEHSLSSSFVLHAGMNQNATISYWTNLAHARTVAECNETPNSTQQHIRESNNMFSDILLFDIIETIPQQIESGPLFFTDIQAMSYGVANAAISYYTYNLDILNGGEKYHQQYNSIVFAAASYDDLVYDKLLDGQGEVGPLSLGAMELSTDTYRTVIPNNIYYTLQATDMSPNSRKDEIAVIAENINQTELLDVFPQIDVTPTTPMQIPEIVTVAVTGCNACWTIVDQDRYVPCEVTMEFTVDEPKNAPYLISGNVAGGQSGTLTAINDSIGPADTTKASFHLTFGFTQVGNEVIGNRNLDFLITNAFGLSGSFALAVDARVPSSQGAWYNMPYTCSADITATGN